MLGRKIIEMYPDENSLDTDTAAAAGKVTNSLPVRRLRSTGLRIITENEVTNINYLQVPDARGRRDSSNSGATSIMTPDTTQTFGFPNPTFVEETHDSGPSVSPSDASSTFHNGRRQQRYTQQEGALKSTFEHCSREPSWRDLQIRALERATTLLSMHAKEAQARANKLRATLSIQRDFDPETYKALQRERWMEERRSNARTEESKALKELMLKLSGPDFTLGTQRTQSLPGGTDPARHQANLLSFSMKSPTKLMFSRRRGSSATRQQAMHRSLTRTISETRPMRLRTSALTAFSKPTKSRTQSLDFDRPVNNSRSGNPPLVRGSAALSSPIPLATTPMTIAQGQDGVGAVVKDGGVATIYASQQPRTREQIDSDMSDVGLPSYAIDLLGEFDDIHGDISLVPTPPARPPPIDVTSQEGRHRAVHLMLPEPTRGSFYAPQRSNSSSPPRSARSAQPSTPSAKVTTFSAIRRPLSFLGHKSADSVSSGGPGSSVRMSGDGVVLAERPSTPVGSVHSQDKPNRWGVPSSSPAKALSKMKNRLSIMGSRR